VSPAAPSRDELDRELARFIREGDDRGFVQKYGLPGTGPAAALPRRGRPPLAGKSGAAHLLRDLVVVAVMDALRSARVPDRKAKAAAIAELRKRLPRVRIHEREVDRIMVRWRPKRQRALLGGEHTFLSVLTELGGSVRVGPLAPYLNNPRGRTFKFGRGG